jgi:hypothetical protein
MVYREAPGLKYWAVGGVGSFENLIEAIPLLSEEGNKSLRIFEVTHY